MFKETANKEIVWSVLYFIAKINNQLAKLISVIVDTGNYVIEKTLNQ